MSDSFNTGQHRAYHTDVAMLESHWGSAYRISYRLGQFRAERMDDGSAVRADSAEELLRLIRADYAQRPISRDVAP